MRFATLLAVTLCSGIADAAPIPRAVIVAEREEREKFQLLRKKYDQKLVDLAADPVELTRLQRSMWAAERYASNLLGLEHSDSQSARREQFLQKMANEVQEFCRDSERKELYELFRYELSRKKSTRP